MRHTELGISLNDINSETDIRRLKEWDRQMEVDVFSMKVQIEGAIGKKRSTGEMQDPVWFSKVNSKRTVYGLLRSQIQKRISFLKEENFYERFFEKTKELYGDAMVKTVTLKMQQ